MYYTLVARSMDILGIIPSQPKLLLQVKSLPRSARSLPLDSTAAAWERLSSVQHGLPHQADALPIYQKFTRHRVKKHLPIAHKPIKAGLSVTESTFWGKAWFGECVRITYSSKLGRGDIILSILLLSNHVEREKVYNFPYVYFSVISININIFNILLFQIHSRVRLD